MKVLIIEDEKAAVRNLIVLLHEVAPQLEVIDTLDSVESSLEWFHEHPLPDLIITDINLGDGSAFEIFENFKTVCPIIFTTAYDEYAIKAFKLNSLDYLLKPIQKEELRHAIVQFESLKQSQLGEPQLIDNIKALLNKCEETTHFLVPLKGDKLYPLSTKSISYFYITNGLVYAKTYEGQSYLMQQSLDEISQIVSPNRFFRANRQYLITRDAIDYIDLWFNNRLSINLKEDKSPVIISRKRVSEFKSWFSNS